MTRVRLACVIGVLCAARCGDADRPAYLDIATTTSVKNSGLLGDLLPAFQAETRITVRAHATGSGHALDMLADEVVDLGLTQAPRLEATYLAARAGWAYRKIAFNRFAPRRAQPTPSAASRRRTSTSSLATTSQARTSASRRSGPRRARGQTSMRWC